ncbi:hypothetical protein SAMN05444007_105154 [Cribrihabitans marinus]|uniref:AAA+ family ATPase n=1 Tax=Cribrihabitans marinus TaxID=1227549 RepID=A0A1H6ZIM3_9RHOB|nr:hypothetical protein [Cribrihabitans marinus]GGH30573.1 hypothetical protein GCM10010973_20820 [Cribrihabitans marinus]SEJ53241.1 hypothetical protein SAMN05444007_105154 [Cribrihabitans marinus]
MKRLAALAFAALIAAPAQAEEPEGKSLMEQGAELFLEGLRQEMSPALEDLQDLAREFGPAMAGFLQEMGPALAELADEVKDWSVYHPPEILPNGDIIIRRKVPEDRPDPVPEESLPEPGPGGAIEL